MALAVGYRRWSAARLASHGDPHFLVAGITYAADFFARFVSCRCSSPSRASIERLMRARRDIFLFPGGFVELARHTRRRDSVDVGSRGAIRLALAHGYAVRVAFSLGEHKTAYNLQWFSGLRVWLAKRRIPAVVPLLLPFARTPTVAFSPTIQFPKIAEPTFEEMGRWHAAYVHARRSVHARFASENDELAVYDEGTCAHNGR
jgi:hypothetical protein